MCLQKFKSRLRTARMLVHFSDARDCGPNFNRNTYHKSMHRTLGMAYLHIFLFFMNYLYTVKQDQFAILLIIIKQTYSILFSKFKFNDWGEPERAPQFGGSSSSSAMYYGALYTLCVRTPNFSYSDLNPTGLSPRTGYFENFQSYSDLQ
jgi:hypothetical protein